MSNDYKNFDSLFKIVRIISIFLSIIAPFLFLYIAYYYVQIDQAIEYTDIIVAVLLAYSAFAPLSLLVIRKAIVRNYLSGKSMNVSPEQLWFKLFIIRAAVSGGIFAFGFLVYFLSGNVIQMLYFYPIGFAWSIVHWPTRDRFQQFLNELKQS